MEYQSGKGGLMGSFGYEVGKDGEGHSSLEEKYRCVVENANEGIFVAQDGMIKFSNPKASEISGYSQEDLSSTPFIEIIHPEDRERVVENHLKRLRGESLPHVYPFRIVDKSDQTRWVEINAVFIKWEGRPATLNFISDVTEHILAKDQVERQGALLEAMNKVFHESLRCETHEEVARVCLSVAQALTRSTMGFIGEVNPTGRFDTIAQSGTAWVACGIARSLAISMIQNMEVRGIWGKVIETGESLLTNSPASHPFWMGIPEGHPEITSFLGAPLKRTGRAFGMIALANKATGYTQEDQEAVETLSLALVEAMDRKRAEEELRAHRDRLEDLVRERTDRLRKANELLEEEIAERREAESEVRRLNQYLERRVEERTRELQKALEDLKSIDQMKDNLLSSVSHELRTPLTSIRSYSEILLRYDDVTPKDRKEFLRIINSETERLTRLITNVLDLSKIEAGMMAWHDVKLSLPELIGEVVRVQEPLFRKKSVRVVQEVPPRLPLVFADRDRVQQVITNLLNNAINLSFEGGQILIKAETFAGKRSSDPGDWIQVSVIDQGIGIPRSDIDIIFEKYRQGSLDTISNSTKGTGLGLSISREIITHYGGNIRVYSQKGEGSRFCFTLPARRPPEANA